MQVTCDGCGRAVEDALCQITEAGREILYLCPECFMQRQEHDPEHQP